MLEITDVISCVSTDLIHAEKELGGGDHDLGILRKASRPNNIDSSAVVPHLLSHQTPPKPHYTSYN